MEKAQPKGKNVNRMTQNENKSSWEDKYIYILILFLYFLKKSSSHDCFTKTWHQLPLCRHKLGLSCTLYEPSFCPACSTVLWPSSRWPLPSAQRRRFCARLGPCPNVCRGCWRPEGFPYRSRPGGSSRRACPRCRSPPPSRPSPAPPPPLSSAPSARCGYTLGSACTIVPILRRQDA